MYMASPVLNVFEFGCLEAWPSVSGNTLQHPPPQTCLAYVWDIWMCDSDWNYETGLESLWERIKNPQIAGFLPEAQLTKYTSSPKVLLFFNHISLWAEYSTPQMYFFLATWQDLRHWNFTTDKKIILSIPNFTFVSQYEDVIAEAGLFKALLKTGIKI